MSLEFTPHILPLLGAALLAVLLLPTAWKNRRDPIALWFGATLVALFVWSVGYTLEIMAVQVLDKIFLANLQFLGVPAIIVCWWEMIRRHVGMRPVPMPISAILWAVPISTVIVAFWNPAHLFRVNPSIVSRHTPFPVLHADYGPWYWWVLVPFMSLVTLASLVLLARALLRSDRFHRRQHALLLVAFLLPLMGSYLYMFNLSPWRDYNPAVALLGLSCLLVAVALFRCQLFAMVPLAREKVVEDLGDPVIVIDRLGRLVDLNRSAERVTGVELRSAIARPAAQVLHAHPKLVEMLKCLPSSSADDAESTDMTVEGPGSPRHFAVTCSPVTTDKGDYLGKVLVMHDVTEREKLLEQTRSLPIATTSPACPTGATSSNSLRESTSERAGIASPSPSCSWTWITSRASTTRSGIGWAISCCRNWPRCAGRRCARATFWVVWEERSSPFSCRRPGWRTPSKWPTDCAR